MRSRYLVGADGGNSLVAEHAGLPFEGQDGRRRVDEHPVPRRSVAPRRAPAQRPLLGDAARRGRRRHRHGPRADGAALERMADRLGLRHQPARAGGDAGARHVGRAPARRRPRARDRAAGGQHLDGEQLLRDAAAERARLHHGRCRAPAPAVERARLEHLDPGRLQPRLEARHRHQGRGDAQAARDLRRRTRASRPADRHPRQPVDRRVRPDLRGARHGRRRGSREDPAVHGRALRRNASRRGPAGRAAQGDRIQEIRVRLPRRGDEPALRFLGRRYGRPAAAGAERRHGAASTSRRPTPAHAFRTSGSSTARVASTRRSI